MGARNYRDLIAWQKAMDLVEGAYRVTQGFPKEELYALTNQIRRSAVSVPSNIAEGEGRYNDNEFIQFLRIAHGSLRELETQLMIGQRLKYILEDALAALMELSGEVGRLIMGLINSLRRDSK